MLIHRRWLRRVPQATVSGSVSFVLDPELSVCAVTGRDPADRTSPMASRGVVHVRSAACYNLSNGRAEIRRAGWPYAIEGVRGAVRSHHASWMAVRGCPTGIWPGRPVSRANPGPGSCRRTTPGPEWISARRGRSPSLRPPPAAVPQGRRPAPRARRYHTSPPSPG